MHLVKLTNISKVFHLDDELDFQALKDINLLINKGEFVAIVGPSGCGKSTLMNIIGLLDRPTFGKYLLEDQDVARFSDNHLAKIRNKSIGFVFQNFNLLPRTKAIDNVGLPLVYSGIPLGQRLKLAKEALTEVGLSEKLQSKPSQLSGGQQQRVAIARALVTNPDIILADEPTGNLDSKTGGEILKLLKELNKKGKTIILITHDHNIAKEAKRRIVLKDGKITN